MNEYWQIVRFFGALLLEIWMVWKCQRVVATLRRPQPSFPKIHATLVCLLPWWHCQRSVINENSNHELLQISLQDHKSSCLLVFKEIAKIFAHVRQWGVPSNWSSFLMGYPWLYPFGAYKIDIQHRFETPVPPDPNPDPIPTDGHAADSGITPCITPFGPTLSLGNCCKIRAETRYFWLVAIPITVGAKKWMVAPTLPQ